MEPETDPKRDQRTVFAYHMYLKATKRNFYEFFSKAGKVMDVRLIMERNSRLSKGVGHIEFYDELALLTQKINSTGIARSIAGCLGVPLLNGSAPNQQFISLPVNGQTTMGAAALQTPALPSPAYG
uniref:RRM domain-containing protein n=1 Tax=Populus trichocarpa TaxID=3694 RepID=B9N8R6_POPTR